MMLISAAILIGIAGQMSSGLYPNPSTDQRWFARASFDIRIAGGHEAPEGRAPHMVALITGLQYKVFLCGGSIITTKHVLTAAHCIVPFRNRYGMLLKTYQGRVGSDVWNRGGMEIQFQGYRIHPKYNYLLVKNDAGILIMKKKLQLSEKVAVISLEFDWVGAGEASYVTGWGRKSLWGKLPERLKILYVSTISASQCRRLVYKVAGQWAWSPPHDPTLEICTFHSVGNGMCHGDSGSALVLARSGRQMGVVSWGVRCASGGPDVFTRVRALRKFIYSVVGSLP